MLQPGWALLMIGQNLTAPATIARTAAVGVRRKVRWFTELDAATSQYYDVTGTIPFEDDVVISLKLQTTTTDTRTVIGFYSDASNEYFRLIINYANFENCLKVESLGHTPFAGTAIINDGVLHHIEMIVTPSTGYVRVYVDGLLDIQGTHTAPEKLQQPLYSTIGAYRNSPESSEYGFITAVISDIRITSGGVPVLDLPLDRPAPADGNIVNRAYGNSGAPRLVAAINLTYMDAMKCEFIQKYAAWVSENILPNSDFADGFNFWTFDEEHWNVVDGIAIGTDLSSYAHSISRYGVIPIDGQYSIVGFEGVTSGDLFGMQDGSSQVPADRAIGEGVEFVEYIWQADTANMTFKRRGGVINQVNLDHVWLRRAFPVAETAS